MAGLPGSQAQTGLKRGLPRPESPSHPGRRRGWPRSVPRLRFRAPQTFGVFQSAGGLLETQVPGPHSQFLVRGLRTCIPSHFWGPLGRGGAALGGQPAAAAGQVRITVFRSVFRPPRETAEEREQSGDSRETSTSAPLTAAKLRRGGHFPVTQRMTPRESSQALLWGVSPPRAAPRFPCFCGCWGGARGGGPLSLALWPSRGHLVVPMLPVTV